MNRNQIDLGNWPQYPALFTNIIGYHGDLYPPPHNQQNALQAVVTDMCNVLVIALSLTLHKKLALKTCCLL